MRNTRMSDLPVIDITSFADNDVTVLAQSEYETARLSVGSIVERVKKSLGYLEKPLVKCRHCGQWGAAYCACRHCGAPIDPA